MRAASYNRAFKRRNGRLKRGKRLCHGLALAYGAVQSVQQSDSRSNPGSEGLAGFAVLLQIEVVEDAAAVVNEPGNR